MIDVLQIAQGRQITEVLNNAEQFGKINLVVATISEENNYLNFKNLNGGSVYKLQYSSYPSCNVYVDVEEVILTSTSTQATVNISKEGNGTVSIQYIGNHKYPIIPGGAPSYTLSNDSSQVRFTYQMNSLNKTDLHTVYAVNVSNTTDYAGGSAYIRVVSKKGG